MDFGRNELAEQLSACARRGHYRLPRHRSNQISRYDGSCILKTVRKTASGTGGGGDSNCRSSADTPNRTDGRAIAEVVKNYNARDAHGAAVLVALADTV